MHLIGDEELHLMVETDNISYKRFDEYAIEHSNKFISNIIKKYWIKVLFNEYK